MPRLHWAKPHEWNSGAATTVVSRAFSGIRSSSAAIGSIDFGCERLAPFGVPVVPEVRIVALPRLLGRGEVGRVAALDQLLELRVVAAPRRGRATRCSA